MHVAVIIPAFNASRFLGEAVQSVIAQTYVDWTLTIADNASTDDTESVANDLASADSRIKVVRLEVNQGPSGARNAGAKLGIHSQTAAALFLDADDVLDPHALTCLIRVLQQYPDAPAAYGSARFIDSEGRRLSEGVLEKNTRTRPAFHGGSIGSSVTCPHTAKESFYFWNCIATPGMVLIRASALETVGLFDTSTRPAEDWDMWIRLARLGPLRFEDRVVLNYRQHESQMSHDWRSTRAARSLVLRKALMNPDASASERSTILRAYRLANRRQVSAKLSLAFEATRHRDLRRAKRELLRAAAASSLVFRREP